MIANITVHWRSFVKNKLLLQDWTSRELIHGLGISVNEVIPDEVIEDIRKFKHAVIHTIIGISDKPVFEQFKDKDLNILLLGYKTFGRGSLYRMDHGYSILEKSDYLKNNIKELFNHFRAISFDNLAIKQLSLRSLINQDLYNQIYMGDDGTFTMYVDLIENNYAVSSTSKRHKINSENIDELFKNVRKIAKHEL